MLVRLWKSRCHPVPSHILILYEAQREVMLRARGIAGVAAVNAENMRMMVNGKQLFRMESYWTVYQHML